MSRSLEKKIDKVINLKLTQGLTPIKKSISRKSKSSERKKLTLEKQSLKKKSNSLSLRKKKSLKKSDFETDLLDSLENNIKVISAINFEDHKKSFFDFRRYPLMIKTHYFLFKLIFCGLILPISIKISGDSRDLKEIMVEHMSFLVIKEGRKYSDVITFIVGNTFKRIISPYLLKVPCLKWVIDIITLSKNQISHFEEELRKIIGRKVFTLKTMMIISSYYKIFEYLFKKGDLSESSCVLLLASVIGLLDIILCSFKSSWCGTFKNIENMTWFIYILIEILDDLYLILENENDLQNSLLTFCRIEKHISPGPGVIATSLTGHGLRKLSSNKSFFKKIIEEILRYKGEIRQTKSSIGNRDKVEDIRTGKTVDKLASFFDEIDEI